MSEEWDPFEDAARLNTATGELGDDAPPVGPPLMFPTLDAWVSGYLVQMYRRDLNLPAARWCRQWFKHAEGIARLEAMWRAWELLRLDPGEGASVWWLNHCDPHMRVLMSETGPFRNCRKGEHSDERSVPLPVDDPPEGLFNINA